MKRRRRRKKSRRILIVLSCTALHALLCGFQVCISSLPTH